MSKMDDPFTRSIKMQIELNRARTPTQRFEALCDLLESLRAMAPRDLDAIQRRKRISEMRERDREKSHAEWRRLYATQRTDTADGV